jgi:hypothetical protein
VLAHLCLLRQVSTHPPTHPPTHSSTHLLHASETGVVRRQLLCHRHRRLPKVVVVLLQQAAAGSGSKSGKPQKVKFRLRVGYHKQSCKSSQGHSMQAAQLVHCRRATAQARSDARSPQRAQQPSVIGGGAVQGHYTQHVLQYLQALPAGRQAGRQAGRKANEQHPLGQHSTGRAECKRSKATLNDTQD